MRLFITPLSDTSLYELHPTRNTGLDEIIEVGKSDSGNYSIRSLLEFELTGSVNPSATYELKLYSALGQHLKKTQRIEVWTASGSIIEGEGYYYQDIYQDGAAGATWEFSGSIPVAPSASARLSFEAGNSDYTVDISTLVRTAISSSQNVKLILKFPTADEADKKNSGNVKFFSSNTHTIYRPLLIAKWNDQVYSTGSLLTLPNEAITVTPLDLKDRYRVGDLVSVNLFAREKYPTRTFATESVYNTTKYYLPSSSYFSVVDDASGVTIIPFDDASRISVSSTGNYIQFPISPNMHPLRHYKLLLRVDRGLRTEIIDPKAVFAVVQ